MPAPYCNHGKVGNFSWLAKPPFAKLLPAKAQKSYVYLSESGHFYVLTSTVGLHGLPL